MKYASLGLSLIAVGLSIAALVTVYAPPKPAAEATALNQYDYDSAWWPPIPSPTPTVESTPSNCECHEKYGMKSCQNPVTGWPCKDPGTPEPSLFCPNDPPYCTEVQSGWECRCYAENH